MARGEAEVPEAVARRLGSRRRAVAQILKSGALYFALVFAAGFVLGPVRVRWVAPRLGPRMAELLEMPVMLVVVVAAARGIVQRLAVPPAPARRLGMGAVALLLMVVAELGLVLPLRGLSIGQYLAGRDPVAGTAYHLALAALALMPLLVARYTPPSPRGDPP